MKREEMTNDAEEAGRAIQHGLQARLYTALVGIIDSVDFDAGTVRVQPSIQGRLTELDSNGQLVEKLVSLPLLVDVPIVWPQCAAGALTLPIAQGDEVLVTFTARPIDSWWQSGGVQAPIDRRMHDLSDGLAHVGITSQPRRLANISAENIQLRNGAGDVFFEITPDGKCRIVATDNVEVVAGGNVTVQAEGNVEVEAAGDATVTAGGEAVVSAPRVDVDSPLINLGGIGWATHVHGDSDTPSGPPA